MDLAVILVPVILVGTTLLAIPLIIRGLRRQRERMRRVADELGFTYHGPDAPSPGEPEPGMLKRLAQAVAPWRITGSRDGVAVTIFTESRGSGKSRTVYTLVEAGLPRPLPYRLLVGRETGLAKLGKALFGIHDVEVGAAEFDAEVRIKAADPEAARRLLADARVRDRILSALRAWPHLTVTEQAVRWEKRGTLDRAEPLREAVDLVVPVAAALRDTGAF